MADKRISQLVDRGTVANNDVVPIVASGASTTNKATISSIQTFMQGNLDMGVTSVGLSMPSAFVVSNSPVTASGNISVTGAGTVSQYIRGDGSLADFPSGGGGGGSSVNYYLNGSVSQGTIGGITYQEMNRTPILGAGTDFTIAADGYIASFITDAGDPALLEIPAGNWNFETYLQASSGGGTPSFYIELYKVNSGGTATLIASNSATPELIAFGTTTTPYFSALAVPTTSLTLTDRLALRYYVTHSGRTITLHTENATLCQIITTFTTGLTALNGLTAQVQNFATGTSGTDFNISSSVSTHTFNLPTASATNRGALSSADWITFNNKQAAGNYVTTDTTQSISGVKTFTGGALRISSGGLGGLPTRIVNAPVSSVALSGFNSIGFNGSNNLFITRETDTNGVILAFNNTDLRTYTLPNVSGTIALTSDLSSGYVPYSGAAANVDLGVYNLTASAIIANGSGSNAGIIHLESNAIHSLVNGYGSIASGTTNQFNFYQTTGAGVFRGAILSLNSITASATRTYTLPDADGTIALTSSLSGYLPLTGGTLTGALNGTSATFSSSVTSNATTSVSFYSGTYVSNSLGDGSFATYSGRIRENLSYGLNIDLYDRSAATWRTPLSFNNTGGAATFSSSVTTPFLRVSDSAGQIGEINSSNANGGYITWNTSGTTIADIGTAQQIFGSGGNDTFGINARGSRSLIFGTNNTARFTIDSTGAATFSSSASSGQNLRLQTSIAAGRNYVQWANGSGDMGYLGYGAADGRFFIVNQLNSDMLFYTNDQPRLTIASTGAATFSSSLGIAITPSGNDGVFQTNGSLGNLGGGTAKRAATIFSTSAENADRPGIILGYDTAGGGIIAAATQSSGQPLNFWTYNGSSWGEKMRITSGGYLKAKGNESTYIGIASLYHELRTGQGDEWITLMSSTSGSPYGLYIRYTNSAPNNNTNYFIVLGDQNADRLRVSSNGNVTNQNGSYGAISDIKLKENIQDATPKLDDLMKVKVRNYNLIGEETKQIGVIAQELEEVFPAMIDESEDFEEVEVPQVDEEGNEVLNEEGEVVTEKQRVSKGTTTKSVKYSVFVPMLIKAMQEQQEQIKELKTEIDSLKNQIK